MIDRFGMIRKQVNKQMFDQAIVTNLKQTPLILNVYIPNGELSVRCPLPQK